MKKKNTLQTTEKRALNPKNTAELKTKIKEILSTPAYGLEKELDRFIAENRQPKKGAKKASELLPIFNLDNCHSFRELVPDWNRGRAVEFTLQLYKEYGCQTASEKALAQTAVIAFEHVLDCSRRMHLLLDLTSDKKIITHEVYPSLLKRMKIIGLEIDRANRQFLTALQTLKQIKTPEMKVNVKSKTAFVAQNQQFNTQVNKGKKGNDENIEA